MEDRGHTQKFAIMTSNEATYDNHMAQLQKLKQQWRFPLTIAEVVFAVSFVFNFALGKLLHLFSQPEEVYNYYNNKGNIFNQWFVKKGWAWTTGVIVLFYAAEFSKPLFRRKLLLGAFLRWVVATCWWVLFTQWCFGVPIMDKVFIFSGGKCGAIPGDKLAAFSNRLHLFVSAGELYESTQISSSTCRRLRGSWEGGHDPLGHVFLLVHSSLYLFHEIKPFWKGWSELYHNGVSFAKNVSRANFVTKLRLFVRESPSAVVLALLALWWFMLLMTNMYFHSLAEKLVGLAFGYVGIAAVYWVPQWYRQG